MLFSGKSSILCSGAFFFGCKISKILLKTIGGIDRPEEGVDLLGISPGRQSEGARISQELHAIARITVRPPRRVGWWRDRAGELPFPAAYGVVDRDGVQGGDPAKQGEGQGQGPAFFENGSYHVVCVVAFQAAGDRWHR